MFFAVALEALPEEAVMHPETRRLALRITARLAMPLTLWGCATTVAPPTPESPASADAGTVPPGQPVVSPPVAARCTTPVDPQRPTESEARCCQETLTALLPAGTREVPPEALPCCRASAAWQDRALRGGPDAGIEFPQRDECCQALHWQGSLTCTPWGPPVPPTLSGERVTSRPVLPLDLRTQARALAPAVPFLPSLRRMAEGTWRGRMVNEYESAEVFEALAEVMAQAGFARAIVDEVRGFGAEERRHGVLCGAVVTALGGEAVAPGTARPSFPQHPDVEPLEAVLRDVLSVCCMSETVAVSLIAAEREEMPQGELRALLTSIWSDEVGHARFGWRLVTDLVPTLDAEALARLGQWLRVAFAHLEDHELAHLPLDARPPEEGRALGLCRGDDARVLFFETVTAVIVPGLEAVGLPAREAWNTRRGLPLAA
jgi:hypothetical protein